MNHLTISESDLLHSGRDEVTHWISRVLVLLGGSWIILVSLNTPGFSLSFTGLSYIALFFCMSLVAINRRIAPSWRFAATLFTISGLWLISNCYLGPNQASGLYGILIVMLPGFYWGPKAGLIAIGALALAWIGTGLAWSHGILPLAGEPLGTDPHVLLYWARTGLTIASGAAIVLGGVQVSVQRLLTLAKKAHEAAASASESEAKLRQLVEAINQAFWIMDVRTRQFIYSSPNSEHIWGRPASRPEDALANWIKSLHPDDRQRMVQRFEQMEVTGQEDDKFRIIRADGAVRWISARSFPIVDASGTMVRIAGVAEDITERKELEAQLLHSQRMEAVGTLASGIAHDVNNMLTPLVIATGLLRDKMTHEKDREFMAMAETGARRGAAVLQQLLELGKGGAAVRAIVPLPELIREVVQFIRGTFPRDFEITAEISPHLWTIEADTNQLHQVLMNLCINARDAMPSGGRITLTAENSPAKGIRLPPSSAAKVASAAAVDRRNPARPAHQDSGERYAVISVSDTGHGIPPEIMARIFDPFFTTKEEGKGTGLGLSSAQRIVANHGGFIRVQSEVGRGTRFSVFLPASAGAARPT